MCPDLGTPRPTALKSTTLGCSAGSVCVRFVYATPIGHALQIKAKGGAFSSADDARQALWIAVVPYSTDWPVLFEHVAAELRAALATRPSAVVEHIGLTSVPGLSAKPIIDIDVITDADDMPAAFAALHSIHYAHLGDLGVADREAFRAPDDDPSRHVYVCRRGALSVRNHLAVRAVLRAHPDLRNEYGAVKTKLASDPEVGIDTYVARKSQILQNILAVSDLAPDERLEILRLNDPDADAVT